MSLCKYRYRAEIAVLSLILILSGCTSREYGIKRASVDKSWIPSSATDISFIELFGAKFFECAVNESDVKIFYSERHQDLSEIIEPITTFSYNYWAYHSKKTFDPTDYAEIHVSNGLFFNKQFDNGARILIVYSRDNKRLYYRQTR